MPNKSYYVKPAKRTTAPIHLAAVVVTSKPVGGSPGSSGVATVFDHASIAVARRRSARWGSSSELSTLTGRGLLRTLEELAPVRGSLWVVSPSASASLVLAGFLPYLLERGAKWSGRAGSAPEGATTRPAGQQLAGVRSTRPLGVVSSSPPAADTMIVSAFVTSGKPDIIRYHVNGKTITWVSGPQYFSSTEASLARTCGYQYRHGFTGDGLYTDGATDPADRALLWLTLFQQFAEWWRAIDGGPFAPTPAGLAMSYVRKRLKAKTVLSCQDPEVRKLEEASIYGGRASTWCYAPVVKSYVDDARNEELTDGRPFRQVLGPVDHYDVRSMYPTLLATRPFPVRYLHTYNKPSIAGLTDMLKRWLVIASVRISTRTGEYPMRAGGRITYPRGAWRTVLATPDLRRALADGEVEECYRAMTYLPGRPFGPPFGELLGMRADARTRGDTAQEEFIKLLSNSFGGKMAQRSHEWQRRPGVAPYVDWGEWPQRDLATGAVHLFRSRGGLVDEKVPAEVPTRPLASCFSHLTAYGRDVMRMIRAGLPARSVVSQDTDGIWVLRSVVSLREALPTLSEYPELLCRHNKSSARARWYGPRHYWTDAGWTLSGMHDPERWSDGLGFRDSYQQTPVNTGVPVPPVWVYECERFMHLRDIPVDGSCDADGWVTPRPVAAG